MSSTLPSPRRQPGNAIISSSGNAQIVPGGIQFVGRFAATWVPAWVKSIHWSRSMARCKAFLTRTSSNGGRFWLI